MTDDERLAKARQIFEGELAEPGMVMNSPTRVDGEWVNVHYRLSPDGTWRFCDAQGQ